MICLWSADPTGKNLIHDLYSVVTNYVCPCKIQVNHVKWGYKDLNYMDLF